MSEHDYGPAQTYEITWRSGHVETVQAHQVSWPGGGAIFGDPSERRRVHFHAAKPWRLVLAADEDDIQTIRNITTGEPHPVDGAP